METALTVVAAFASAAAAGALLVGVFVILPLLLSLSVKDYPGTNTFVLARMDKLMPAAIAVAVAAGLALAVLLDDPVQRTAYATGAVALAAVAGVSIAALGPLNKAVRAIDPAAPRPDWRGLRVRWRTWHLVRVGLGQAGALLYVVGLVIAL
ncbi:anthrone oxygenase family protein [Nocardiopsis halophila]|uniref:anthrone oxygenase family protein n=1 Tax=Nocardiopsis halophila TaxID=141692 RepID=UPI00034A61A0|nr:anthrone oxygenase family protein [Nocardiopsis halophila]